MNLLFSSTINTHDPDSELTTLDIVVLGGKTLNTNFYTHVFRHDSLWHTVVRLSSEQVTR